MFTVGTTTYTREQISPLLDIAFGKNSTYWASLVYLIEPTTWEFESSPSTSGKHHAHDYPLNPGGAAIIRNNDDAAKPLYRLDAEAVQRGLTIMHQKFPEAFEMFFNGDADIVIAVDALIQCAFFGDVLF